MNIVETIREAGKDNSALAVNTENFSVNYARLFSDMDAAAAELATLGVKSDARVAMLAPDSYEYIVFSLAVLKLNAAVIPVPVNSSGAEIKSILEKIKVNHIIFIASCFASNEASILKTSGFEDEQYFFATLRDEESKPVLPEPLKAAFIRFSSGTTGGSKGVVLSHRAIIERTAAADKALKISQEDNILWVLDMSFHFVVTILLFLRKRATIVLCGPPLPEKMSKALSANDISVIYATPYHYSLMTRFASFNAGMMASLRLAISTAMKLQPEPAEKFLEKFAFNLTQAYGIIEVGLAFINTSPDKEKCDSVGRILPDYELKLRNPDSEGRGEILLKGPGMFDAYFEPFTLRNEDWFSSGDIGRLDEDGYLYIVGRSKNVINFIGMKIFPYEVENVLLAHPAVAEVKVEGRPHESFGEIPVAFVVLKPGYSEEIGRELRKFCRQCLAPYCVPKEFIFVPELARTRSGKIIRN